MSIDGMIASAKAKVKGKGKGKSKVSADDFDVDLSDTSKESAAGKKAQRSKRRAGSKSAAEEKPAKGKAAKSAKSAKPAKAEKKPSRADKKAAAAEKTAKAARSTRATKAVKGAKASAKPARGDKKAAKATSVTLYKGSIGDHLTAKLDRPGKLNLTDPNSVANHFSYQLNKAANKKLSPAAIAKSLVGAASDAYGAKVTAADFQKASVVIQKGALNKLARAAKSQAASLKASAKEGKLKPAHISDAVNSVLSAE